MSLFELGVGVRQEASQSSALHQLIPLRKNCQGIYWSQQSYRSVKGTHPYPSGGGELRKIPFKGVAAGYPWNRYWVTFPTRTSPRSLRLPPLQRGTLGSNKEEHCLDDISCSPSRDRMQLRSLYSANEVTLKKYQVTEIYVVAGPAGAGRGPRSTTPATIIAAKLCKIAFDQRLEIEFKRGL